MVRDRRSVARHLTSVTGKIYSSGSPVVPCTIVDISERGARLQFVGVAPPHDNFMLVIEDLGEVHSGTVRWRRGTTVGIEFTRDPDDLLI